MALGRRATIDMARGIVKAQNGCTGEKAFEMLRSVSKTHHAKLHDVALEVIASVAGTPGRPHFEPQPKV